MAKPITLNTKLIYRMQQPVDGPFMLTTAAQLARLHRAASVRLDSDARTLSLIVHHYLMDGHVQSTQIEYVFRRPHIPWGRTRFNPSRKAMFQLVDHYGRPDAFRAGDSIPFWCSFDRLIKEHPGYSWEISPFGNFLYFMSIRQGPDDVESGATYRFEL